MGISDWVVGLFDDGSSDREEYLLVADEMNGKRERAKQKLDAANREADRFAERHTEAMDREYAASLKMSLVADRLVVVMDQLWAADKNGDIDVGKKLADWDDEAEELAKISHGLEMLHQRFEEQRDQAETDAKEWERRSWMAIARGNDLEQQIRKYSERYDEAIEAAGL